LRALFLGVNVYMQKKKINFLVIDDSQVVRQIMHDELVNLGYSVHLAKSAEAALEMIKQPELAIDFVFLDYMLPGINGLQFLDELKKIKRHPVVVMMTAYESTESAVEAIERGAYDYVIKPISPSHLEIIIYRAMKRYEVEQTREKGRNSHIKTVEAFESDTFKIQENLNKLKMEVNLLLRDLGRPEKYKIS